MTLFWLSLMANTVTLVVAVAAAVMRPMMSYRLIAGTAISAFLASLHQVATARGNVLALLLNGLLVGLISYRGMMNLWKKNR